MRRLLIGFLLGILLTSGVAYATDAFPWKSSSPWVAKLKCAVTLTEDRAERANLIDFEVTPEGTRIVYRCER